MKMWSVYEAKCEEIIGKQKFYNINKVLLNSGINIESGKTNRIEKIGNGYKRKILRSYFPKVFPGISTINDVL